MQGGRVVITKHDSPKAVLISIEEFNALTRANRARLDTLSGEFDALPARMQTPAARVGKSLMGLDRENALLPAGSDECSLEEITAVVSSELRRMAGGYLNRADGNGTLQPTALVHGGVQRSNPEELLRLVVETDAGKALGGSSTTVKRDLKFARAWLLHELTRRAL
jgi:antitoxin (DNA-binding transcriptional repressor) of toxin-antitoxin stability system